MTEFDYLVIGAGSAGCTIANELARVARVGLVEAGCRQATEFVRRPADFLKLFNTESDWAFETVVQPGLAGRSLRFPRGRGLGGSTKINASIWLKPHEECFQQFSAATNNHFSVEQLGTAYEVVCKRVAPEQPRWLSESAQRFIDAARSIGLDAHPFQRMNVRGVRKTAADALSELENIFHVAVTELPRNDQLLPSPTGLVVLADTLVDRIELESGKAVGVHCQPATQRSNIRSILLRSRHGVILCGGAVASPAILQRSGVGCESLLRSVGIKVKVALPEVGNCLRDHLIFPASFSTPHTTAFPQAWSPRQLARWKSIGTGPIASNIAEAGLFHGQGSRQIQLHLTPTDYLRHPTRSIQGMMTLGVTLARPQSCGGLRVASSDPQQSPFIDPAYLSVEQDLEQMHEGLHLVRQLADTEPLRHWVNDELLPGKRGDKKCIQRFSQTLYHPVGGCCIGSVVNERLQVHETENLWVADASVLPYMPAANPNPLVMAISQAFAEKLA